MAGGPVNRCFEVYGVTDRGALHGHWNAPALAAATQPNVFAVNMQCDVHCKKGEEEEEGLKVIQSKAVNEV